MSRWRWTVNGRELDFGNSPGARVRSVEDTGTVEGELLGDAVTALTWSAPFWGLLDPDHKVTITIEPVEEAA